MIILKYSNFFSVVPREALQYGHFCKNRIVYIIYIISIQYFVLHGMHCHSLQYSVKQSWQVYAHLLRTALTNDSNC